MLHNLLQDSQVTAVQSSPAICTPHKAFAAISCSCRPKIISRRAVPCIWMRALVSEGIAGGMQRIAAGAECAEDDCA